MTIVMQGQTVVNQQRALRGSEFGLEGQDPRVEEQRWLLVELVVRS